jgi:hypothetical protein
VKGIYSDLIQNSTSDLVGFIGRPMPIEGLVSGKPELWVGRWIDHSVD